MLFCFSIICGALLNASFMQKRTALFADHNLHSVFCFPIALISLWFLQYYYRHDPMIFFVLHTALCLIVFLTDFPRLRPKAASEDSPECLYRELEQLAVCFLECSSIVLSMLIGGAPLAILTSWLCAAASSENIIRRLILFFPARLGAFVLIITSGLLHYDFRNGRHVYQRDRSKRIDSGVGHILSAYAGCLHLCFPTANNGMIGNVDRTPHASDIPTMSHICFYSLLFMLLMGCFIRLTFLL